MVSSLQRTRSFEPKHVAKMVNEQTTRSILDRMLSATSAWLKLWFAIQIDWFVVRLDAAVRCFSCNIKALAASQWRSVLQHSPVEVDAAFAASLPSNFMSE